MVSCIGNTISCIGFVEFRPSRLGVTSLGAGCNSLWIPNSGFQGPGCGYPVPWNKYQVPCKNLDFTTTQKPHWHLDFTTLQPYSIPYTLYYNVVLVGTYVTFFRYLFRVVLASKCGSLNISLWGLSVPIIQRRSWQCRWTTKKHLVFMFICVP